MSDILDMLRDVPPLLAAAWGGWLVAGLMLLLWHLRAREWERSAIPLRASAPPRSTSGVRLPSGSGVRTPAEKPATVDAFAELEALLDPPQASGTISRRPGD